MKRKLLIFALVMLLAISTCFGMVACGGGSADGGEGAGTGGENGGNGGNGGEAAGLVLVENGKPTFQFVYSNDFSNDISAVVKNNAENAIKNINKVLSTEAKKVNENHENETEIEIIFGSPKFRGDEYVIDQHYLGPEGYAVKVVGKKILVLYGSETAVPAAITHLKEVVFGITSKTKELKSLSLTKDKLIEAKQSFTLESATVAGNDLKSYVLEYPTSLREQAQAIQNELYNKVGIWLPKGTSSASKKAVIIKQIDNGGEGTTENGFIIYVDENQNLVIQTEFPNKVSEGVGKFLSETILAGGKKEMAYAQDYVFDTFDARNIYYEDFGAKGNDTKDDFEAIKACHAEANKYGHTVNAKPSATYYIGKNEAGTAAIIQTDVNWNGCKFIFDDTDIEPKSAGYGSAIFLAQSGASDKSYSLSKNNLPFTSIEKGATNIGWAPGYDCLIFLTNSNVKHFIRHGSNADNGASQTELILVDKDGNIDPSTPLQWTYEVITSMNVKGINDKPIVINGGEYDPEAGIDNRALIQTKHNQAPSEYTYYDRNIKIIRSNVILKNVKHIITDFVPRDEGGHGAPYNGFTSIYKCHNVIVEGFEFQNPPSYSTTGSGGGTVGMGTYEISATSSNKVLWQNCTQSNFFVEGGAVKFHGMMGTNYCKNLTFDNMFVCSFDAHKGTYNATILNSTVEHLNFIGEGTIYIENTTIYTDGAFTIANLRNDYGSTWQGKLIAKDVTLKYSTQYATRVLSVIKADWFDHYFGYQTYLPEYIELDNIKLVQFDYGLTGPDNNKDRWEQTVAVNAKPLYILPAELTNNKTDITPSGMWGGSNPYMPPQCLNIKNCGDLVVTYTDYPMFKDMWVYVDGELVREAPSKKEFIPHY